MADTAFSILRSAAPVLWIGITVALCCGCFLLGRHWSAAGYLDQP